MIEMATLDALQWAGCAKPDIRLSVEQPKTEPPGAPGNPRSTAFRMLQSSIERPEWARIPTYLHQFWLQWSIATCT